MHPPLASLKVVMLAAPFIREIGYSPIFVKIFSNS